MLAWEKCYISTDQPIDIIQGNIQTVVAASVKTSTWQDDSDFFL